MGGLNQIELSLTIIFVISLVVLFAEFSYVLWRRRFFHRQRPNHQGRASEADGGNNSLPFSDASSPASACIPISKDLLYFYFCMNSSRISRVEPDSAPPSHNSDQPCPEDDMAEVIDLFKLQNMYGPPRFLFTIKEEERENEAAPEYQSDKDHKPDENCENDSKRSVKLEECFRADSDDDEYSYASTVVAQGEEKVTGESVADGEFETVTTTPFSTPCESPSHYYCYYTPSASPDHQLEITIEPSPSAANNCEEN